MNERDTFGGTEDLGDSLETVVRQELLLNDKHVYLSDETLRKDEPIIKDAIIYGWIDEDKFIFSSDDGSGVMNVFDMVKGTPFPTQFKPKVKISPDYSSIMLRNPGSGRYDIYDINDGFSKKKKLVKDTGGSGFFVSPGSDHIVDYPLIEGKDGYYSNILRLSCLSDKSQEEIKPARFLYWKDNDSFVYVHIDKHRNGYDMVYSTKEYHVPTNTSNDIDLTETDLGDHLEISRNRRSPGMIEVVQDHTKGLIRFINGESIVTTDINRGIEYYSAVPSHQVSYREIDKNISLRSPYKDRTTEQDWSTKEELHSVSFYGNPKNSKNIRYVTFIEDLEGDIKGFHTSSRPIKVSWRPR